MRFARRIFLAAIAIGISGCAVVETNTTRFHTMTDDFKQKSFAVVPAKEQSSSLEFRQYASLVADKLRAYGLVQAPSPKAADLHVYIGYGIDSGKTSSSAIPIFGETSPGTTVGSGLNSTYVPPSYGVVDVISTETTTYRRELLMDIIDAKTSKGTDVKKIFEGKVISSGRSNSFAAVSRCLIDAMFDGFPGVSGRTVNRSIPSNSCTSDGE